MSRTRKNLLRLVNFYGVEQPVLTPYAEANGSSRSPRRKAGVISPIKILSPLKRGSRNFPGQLIQTPFSASESPQAAREGKRVTLMKLMLCLLIMRSSVLRSTPSKRAVACLFPFMCSNARVT